MKKLLNPGIMALTVLASSQALANNFYIGMTAGQATYDISGFDKPTAYEVYGGYQFHKNYAIEIGYNEFGKATEKYSGVTTQLNTTVTPAVSNAYAYNFFDSIDGQSLSAALKLIIPATDKLSFYAKLGFHFWDITRTIQGFNEALVLSNAPVNFKTETDDKDAEPMYGIGTEFEVMNNLNLGLRYTAFKVDDKEMSTYGLSVNYKFKFK